MSAQRIVIAMHDFFRGGSERVALDLAGRWAAAGRDVTILCGSEAGGLRGEVPPGVGVVALNPPVGRGLLSRLQLGPAMAPQMGKLAPQLIFLPGNFHLPLARVLRKVGSRPAIALKISNPPVPQGLAGKIIAPLFRHFARGVDGFAAMNAGLAAETAPLVDGKPIVTLYDPAQIGDVPVSRQPDDRPEIVWIGRLEPQKDAGLALRAFRILAQTTSAHLVMLGDGAQERAVDRDIRELGLQGRVTRHGHVSDVAPYLARARLLLVTSQYEGGPAVAIEALSLGTPVVSTDCSHLLRDVMTSPQAGQIVASRAPEDLAAAMQAVIAAPRPARETLQALTRNMEPVRCARAYLDWFDELARARVS